MEQLRVPQGKCIIRENKTAHLVPAALSGPDEVVVRPHAATVGAAIASITATIALPAAIIPKTAAAKGCSAAVIAARPSGVARQRHGSAVIDKQHRVHVSKQAVWSACKV